MVSEKERAIFLLCRTLHWDRYWVQEVHSSFSYSHQQTQPRVICFASTSTLDGQLKRFWEQEEICTPIMTPEERSCEEYFNATTIRTTEGRYVVRLALNSQESTLGDS
jgi:hypothetical protein